MTTSEEASEPERESIIHHCIGFPHGGMMPDGAPRAVLSVAVVCPCVSVKTPTVSTTLRPEARKENHDKSATNQRIPPPGEVATRIHSVSVESMHRQMHTYVHTVGMMPDGAPQSCRYAASIRCCLLTAHCRQRRQGVYRPTHQCTMTIISSAPGLLTPDGDMITHCGFCIMH